MLHGTGTAAIIRRPAILPLIPYFRGLLLFTENKQLHMTRFFSLALAVSLGTSGVFAQPTTPEQIARTYEARNELAAATLLRNYPVRNIGPTVQGGRIVDIDVNTKKPREFYIAFASGGIFKTVNNGISFTPVFDNVGALGLGDIALSQADPNVLYAGTGEKNSSRSSYAGSGVYKTTDGGQTWTHLGLTGTQHISRIVIHPANNDVVWVAAAGSLYSKNEDRGVFKTTDGGRTWKKTLFINDSTGVIDLVVNPKDPSQVWASAWERQRSARNFKGNGPGSAIYRSLDGGETWEKSVEGFPQGKQVGRIGLEISPSDPNILYAILDNQGEVEDKDDETPDASKLKITDFFKYTREDVLKLDDKKLDEFLDDNGFPEKYDAARVKQEIRDGKYGPKAIATYFGDDANEDLFNTKVIGAEMYRSDDAGVTWKKMNQYDLDGVFNTYGYYFGEMRVAPDNPDLLYLFGVPLLKSRDGGVTWHRLDTLRGVRNIHVDHHALWINPNDPKHLLLGNDGGLYQSYDEGAEWLHINNMPVGQFYTVNVDMEKPYHVYGGLQDNGVLKGSSRSVPNRTRHWEEILGGDGMYVAPDPRNSNIVYAGFQFGNYYRIDTDNGRRARITPQHDIGEAPLRWNWLSPLMLSPHNADIVYMAANRLYRSFDRGEHWAPISDDLTRNYAPQGNVPFSTISCIDESKLKFGVLYVGTDDGNVWVSRNGGGSWTLINEGLPKDKWVSSVSASPHSESTVFVSLNGYRDDDFRTWLFMSDDYGKTWRSIKGNLPESVANVVIQDPVQKNLLYCGLDVGTFVSLDQGGSWHLMPDMLNVPAYDMMVHPRDNELVVGTHGRSVFVADVKPLQELAVVGSEKTILAFDVESLRHSSRWGDQSYLWSKPFLPSVEVLYYVGRPSGSVAVEIFDDKNNKVAQLNAPGGRGFHVVKWDLKVEMPSAGKKKRKQEESAAKAAFAPKGKYRIKFVNGEESSETVLEIR